MKEELHRFIVSTIGIIFLGSAINLLSWHYKLISGGLPGYGLNVNYLTGFPVGLFLFIANSIILGLSFLIAGKTAGLRGVYGYTFLSIFIDLSRELFNLQQIETASLTTNALLISLQGIIAPIGIALVMANEYSFGSYSSMMPIVSKFSKISAPKFFFIMDFILALITLYFFGVQMAGLMLLNATVFLLYSNIPYNWLKNLLYRKRKSCPQKSMKEKIYVDTTLRSHSVSLHSGRTTRYIRLRTQLALHPHCRFNLVK